MIKTKKEYEIYVKEQVQKLERLVDTPIFHGSEGVCINCGQFGYYDLKGLGLSASSIFFSTVFGEWRCRMCEYDSLSI